MDEKGLKKGVFICAWSWHFALILPKLLVRICLKSAQMQGLYWSLQIVFFFLFFKRIKTSQQTVSQTLLNS